MENGHHLPHQEMLLEGDGETPPLLSSSNTTLPANATTTNAASSTSLLLDEEAPRGSGNLEEKEQEEDVDAIHRRLSGLSEASRGDTLGGNNTMSMHQGDDSTITEPIRGANGADHDVTANDGGSNDNVVVVDGIESQQHFAGTVTAHGCSNLVQLPCGMDRHGEEIRGTSCRIDSNDSTTTMRMFESGSYSALRDIIESALEVLRWDSAPPDNDNDDGSDNDNDDDYHNDEADGLHHPDDRPVVETDDDDDDDHHLIDEDDQPYDYHQRQ